MEPDDAVVKGSQIYFILEKYIVTIHFWNHMEDCIKKNNAFTKWFLQWSFLWFYGNMKRKQVSDNLVLKWNVFMQCILSLVQIKTTVVRGSIHWDPTIDVDSNVKNSKNGKKHYFYI